MSSTVSNVDFFCMNEFIFINIIFILFEFLHKYIFSLWTIFWFKLGLDCAQMSGNMWIILSHFSLTLACVVAEFWSAREEGNVRINLITYILLIFWKVSAVWTFIVKWYRCPKICWWCQANFGDSSGAEEEPSRRK